MVRRNLISLLEALLEAIPVNSTMPISTIALKAEMDARYAKRLIEIMIWIQSQPTIKKVTIGTSHGYHLPSHSQRMDKEKKESIKK